MDKYRTINVMVLMYCKAHHNQGAVCPDCMRLLEYTNERIMVCRQKSTCDRCHIHCYSKDKREEIQKVMRFSGPRMIYTHPILAAKHLIHRGNS